MPKGRQRGSALNLWLKTKRRHFLAYHPGPALARLAVPVLVFNGSLDIQVPAKENLNAARQALKNNPNATVMELPGMNHLLQGARTGTPSEYNDIEETMSPTALKIITDWLRANVLTHRQGSRLGNENGLPQATRISRDLSSLQFRRGS